MGKVKAQLLANEEHEEFMRDQEPDFDDYAKVKEDVYSQFSDGEILDLVFALTGTDTVPDMIAVVTGINDIAVTAFDKVFTDGEACDGCEYSEVTKDAYSTGDSPTLRECTAKGPIDCPGLD